MMSKQFHCCPGFAVRRAHPAAGIRCRWRAGLCRALLIVCLLLAPYPGSLSNPTPARAQAQGVAGGFMELTSVFFGEGTRTFGPGQLVTISGSIPSIPWCPTMALPGVSGRGEGIFDFFPVADFYVIKDDGKPVPTVVLDENNLPTAYKLEDVSGTPNRITGGVDGVFVDEIVGITAPAGKLTPGRYRIVMNQCLSGRYDPFTDIVLGDTPNLGFEVTGTGDLPSIDYHALKQRAQDYAEELSGTKIGALGVDVKVPGLCNLYGKLAKKLPTASNLTSFAKIALDRCADLIAEQKGIAADPPDPNFTEFAQLGPISYDFTDAARTPLELALRNLAHALAEHAVLSQGLLTSTERFQGAMQAGNDEYAMLQLRWMKRYIFLLMGSGGAMLRTYAAIEALDLALQRDPVLGQLQEASDLHAFVPQIRQAIGGLMVPLYGELRRVTSGGQDLLVPYGLGAFVDIYLETDPSLVGLGLPGIPTVRARHGLPPIQFHHPQAGNDGPYNAAPQTVVHFDASRSSDPNGDTLTYAWDFTGDGNFNDGAGAKADFTFPTSGTRLVGVKVSNPAGNSDVSYTTIRIGDQNTEEIFGIFDASGDIYHFAPDGSFNRLGGAFCIQCSGHALHVNPGGDFWILYDDRFEHFDSSGKLLDTEMLSQIVALTGKPFIRMNDFVIDGHGDLLLLAQEDLGPGEIDRYQCGPAGLLTQAVDTAQSPGAWYVVRVKPDFSSATLVSLVSRSYLNPHYVNGKFVQDQYASEYFEDPSLALDPQGNLLVSAVNGPSPQNDQVQDGFWKADPVSGALTEMIPADFAVNCGEGTTPFGTFQRVFLAFGSQPFAFQGGLRAGGGIHIDVNGNVITNGGNSYLGIERIFWPPQFDPITDINLHVEAFPVLNSAPYPGASIANTSDLPIDSSGDFIAPGIEYNRFVNGIWRVAPDGEFSLFTTIGALGRLSALDVLPRIRNVTQKDIPPLPQLNLSALTLNQQDCPGDVTLSVTLTNTGSGPATEPVTIFFFDGDPEGPGQVIDAAIANAPLAPGVPVPLSIQWLRPTGGTHHIFAMALGANLASGVFQVCVPALPPSPVVLSPVQGTDPVGSMHSVVATAKDPSGGPFSGLTVDFQVTGANPMTASGVTDASGMATFTYKGTAAGQDTIVVMSLGTNSNEAIETWTGASDTIPPVVTPPASISIPATEAGGARGSATAALAAFLAGGSAVDNIDPSPARLAPQVGGMMNADNSTLFALGTTIVAFRFQDASGNIGSATASVTVSLGTPRLNGTLVSKGRDGSGNFYVDVRITDNGTGNARAVKITQLPLRTLSGTGTVSYNTALSGALPTTVGDLDVGASTIVRFCLNVPATVTRFSITQSGTVQDVSGNSFNFSQAQSVIP